MGKLIVTPNKPAVIADEEFKLRRQGRNTMTKCTVLWSVHDANTNEILAHHSDTATLGANVFVPDATEPGQKVRVPLSSMPKAHADAFRAAGKVKTEPAPKQRRVTKGRTYEHNDE